MTEKPPKREFEAHQGTILVTDLRSSTFGAEQARQAGWMPRFVEQQDEYFATLLGDLEKDAGETGVRVYDISYGGDGVTVVADLSRGAVEWALRLQETCDRIADRLRAAVPPGADGGGKARFRWATGIGVATGEVVRLDERSSGIEAYLQERGFRRRFTGGAFNVATRIEAKAQPGKACFSPLLDERTCSEAELSELKIFPVGYFVVDKKASSEVPRISPWPGQPSRYSPLFSVVRRGSILEPAAELFDRAVERVFNRRVASAFEALMELGRYLDGNEKGIRAALGSNALWRWRKAVYHYSYLPSTE